MPKITMDPKHPAWNAMDDDDWNGATFANWLTTIKESDVVLVPPKDWTTERIEQMRVIVARHAKSVSVKMGS